VPLGDTHCALHNLRTKTLTQLQTTVGHSAQFRVQEPPVSNLEAEKHFIGL